MPVQENNIQFGGQPDYEDFDAVAGAEITPGMLVEVTDIDEDGVLTVVPHGTDGAAPRQPLFADIVPWGGEQGDVNSTNPVDDTFAAGEYVRLIGAKRYNRVNALLAAGGDLVTAADATIDPYEPVTSAGNGTLRSAAAGGEAFAHSYETATVDNAAAAAGETGRLIIEVE